MCPHALYGSYFLVMFDALQNHTGVFCSLMTGGVLENDRKFYFSSPFMKSMILDE